jgi:hypothetical protein
MAQSIANKNFLLNGVHVAKYELDVIAPIRSANKMILALAKAEERADAVFWRSGT